MLTDFLKNRDPSAPIQGSWLNLTAAVWVFGVLSLIALSSWDSLVGDLIGAGGVQDPTLRTVLVVSILAAMTIVTVGDMFARAIATAKGGGDTERHRKLLDLIKKEYELDAEIEKLLAEDKAGKTDTPAPA